MAAQSHNSAISTKALSHRNNQKIRAVIADDTPLMQKLIVCVLEFDGLVEVVGITDNGTMAVELVEALGPDLVLLDVNMPKMTGLEAALRIKKSLPDTKVLIVSADHDPDMGLCAPDCGADGFIRKDNLMKECANCIQRMFPHRCCCITSRNRA